MFFLGGFVFLSYLCAMIYEIVIGILVYTVLFVVTVQSSRRKVLDLQKRLDKVRALQMTQQAQSQQNIAQNEAKIQELETLLKKLGDENSLLRLELEEKKATLAYNNKVAIIENEKRQQAETVIFSSAIYHHIQECLNSGRSLGHEDWTELAGLVNSIYTGFTEKLYGLYRLSEQDYHVSLLIKVRIQPKDIALLTAHSKESVASTRSRLYQKVFGQKGSSKDWDDFVLTL
jgi:regulator of replication initiation timing